MDPELDIIEAETPDETVDELAEGEHEDVSAEGGEDAPEQESSAEQEPEDGEISITIGDEPASAEGEDDDVPPEKSGGLIKDLRHKLKLASREVKQLRAERESSTQKPAEIVLGEKPKMSDPDIDFDEEKFAERVEQWAEQKAKADEQKRKKDEADQAFQAAWQKKLKDFDDAKAKLPVPDYEDAETLVDDHFDITQRGILIDCAKDPVKLKYALGKNAAKLKELGAIKNYAQFTYQLAQLETQLKVTKRNAPPPPERVIRSNVTGAAAVDSQIERLRAEARKSGDYSKVTEFNRAQGAKANQRKA